MKEKLEILLQEGKERILAAKTEVELQEIKASLLGKKGSVTEMMKELPKLAPEDRREFGQAVNKVKGELSDLVDA
ncbi:MAG: phenylalanine--tRNA ligase subunit alpha, partial [Firmicutes bacterium]|nr:phenylalanine--tRNA ligase subunit alpha [Bacillota bacterium]